MDFIRWFTLFYVFFTYVEASGGQQVFASCGSHGLRRKRIVGGEKVSITDYPWIAELRESKPFISCGAAIIHPNFVLSAAHCFKWRPDAKINVTFGIDGMEFSPENSRKVVKFIRYPNYTRTTHNDDIMLLKLDKPIQFTDKIQPICLPEHKESENATNVEVLGFGRINYKGDFSKNLRAVDLKIVANDECGKVYFNETLFPTNICAGGELGKDACQGDSGAPLVMKKDLNYYIIGLVSWGRECAREGVPGIYTRVSSYIDWIYDVIRREMMTSE